MAMMKVSAFIYFSALLTFLLPVINVFNDHFSKHTLSIDLDVNW